MKARVFIAVLSRPLETAICEFKRLSIWAIKL